MVQIFRKEGWCLNPNDKVVNAILKRCEINNGECPCHNTGEDKNLIIENMILVIVVFT